MLLLPSIWPENQPVSITEAMAAGMPVIASRIGGIPELVEDDRTGFLVEPGDPAELASKMRAFVENPDLLEAQGIRAAERMAENTLDRRVAEYVARYDAIRATSAIEPVAEAEPLVVCVGPRFSHASAATMAALGHTAIEARFVMREWIDDALLARAALVWVVDEAADVPSVVALASRGIPLLVPTAARALARLCVDGNCGLYYADEHEARACLELLVEDGRTREGLGANAARYGARG